MEITDQKAEEIIARLDDYAREHDPYEYGLPGFNEAIDEMKKIIIEVLKGITKK